MDYTKNKNWRDPIARRKIDENDEVKKINKNRERYAHTTERDMPTQQ